MNDAGLTNLFERSKYDSVVGVERTFNMVSSPPISYGPINASVGAQVGPE
jgi:hypothetical protein